MLYWKKSIYMRLISEANYRHLVGGSYSTVDISESCQRCGNRWDVQGGSPKEWSKATR